MPKKIALTYKGPHKGLRRISSGSQADGAAETLQGADRDAAGVNSDRESLNLVVPQLISRTIDAWTRGQFVLHTIVEQFLAVALAGVHSHVRAERDADLCGGTSGEGYSDAYRREDLVAVVCVGGRNHARKAADESHVRRGFGEDVRIDGDRDDYCVGVSHRRREHIAALDQLAAGAGRPRHRAVHCDYVPAGAAKSAHAVQARRRRPSTG